MRYLGHPHRILTDRGTQFIARDLIKWAGEAGICIDSVGMESPSSLGIGERIHGPLRRTYDAMVADMHESSVSKDLLLQTAVKAWNDSNGVDGLCPSLLVYGAYPALPINSHKTAALPHSERAKLREFALREMRAAIDDRRAEATDHAQSPALPEIAPGDKVLVFRKDLAIWDGPYTLVSETPKGFYVRSSNASGREVQLHSKPSVKKYRDGLRVQSILPPTSLEDEHLPEAEDEKIKLDCFVPENANQDDASNIGIAKKNANDTGDANSPLVRQGAGRGRKRCPKCHNYCGTALRHCPCGHTLIGKKPEPIAQATGNTIMAPVVRTDITGEAHEDMAALYAQPFPRSAKELDTVREEIALTEVLGPRDPRRTTRKMRAAIALEDKGLAEQGVFMRMRIPRSERGGLNILRSRYVLAVKDGGTPKQRAKARLVVQAMKRLDRDYPRLFTYSPTVSRATTRIALTLAASENLLMGTRDISQAYVCTTHELLRRVYVVPPKEACADPDELWLLVRPLYGLPEAGAMWYSTLAQYHRKDLKMRATRADAACFYRISSNGKLEGLSSLQVDDSLLIGTHDFMREEAVLSKIFLSKGREEIGIEAVAFNGMDVKWNSSGCGMRGAASVSCSQERYTEMLPSEATTENFARARGQASYVTTSTRPDVCAAIAQSAQVFCNAKTIVDERDCALLTNALLRLAKPRALVHEGLDLSTVHLRVYCDASFANNRDLSSQLGVLVFMVDRHEKCSLIHYSSRKARRVCRSTMASEVLAISEGFDVGYLLRDLVAELLQRHVELRVYTDAKVAWDAIISLSTTTERRLTIDLFGLREAYRLGDMENLCRVSSYYNPSDAMTKL